ncbi:MAG: GNAT family N-acetyltransferase, partial [Wenzhouxiangellaceae bacterium]
HPRARRQGFGARLMQVQHEHVRQLGYLSVTTRTRAANRAMLILNLKNGFEIVGFEVDGAGFTVVSQRKSLA